MTTKGKNLSPLRSDIASRASAFARGVATGGATYGDTPLDTTGGSGVGGATSAGATGPVTSFNAQYTAEGHVQATWVNPDDLRFDRVQVTISDTETGATRFYIEGRGTSVLWTYDQNEENDPTVTVTVVAMSYDGSVSTPVSSAIAAVVPTLTSVVAAWNAATGDVTFTHNASTATIRLAIDGYLYDAPTPFIYTLAQNRVTHGGTPDPVLSWSAVAANGFGQVTTAITGTATLPAPTAPTLSSQSWASDPSTAGADLGIVVSALAGSTIRYVWTVDGVVQPDSTSGVLSYSFAKNTTDHSGTPDPVLSVVVTGYDVLGRASSALAFTATNAAPPTVTSISTQAAVDSLAMFVTATKPNDFATYRYRIIQTSPSAADVLFDSTSPNPQHQVTATATYAVGVRMGDVFGQLGAETVSTAVVLDPLTLSYLRADLVYSDSASNIAGTLSTLKDNDTGTGVTY